MSRSSVHVEDDSAHSSARPYSAAPDALRAELERDDARESAAQQSHSRRHSVASSGPPAGFLADCRSRIHAHLPHKQSRIFFLLLLTIATVALAVWLRQTLSSKWINAQLQPDVKISVQRMDALPPIRNLVFGWGNKFFNAAAGAYVFDSMEVSNAMTTSSAPYREIQLAFEQDLNTIPPPGMVGLFECSDSFFFETKTLCAPPGLDTPSDKLAFVTAADVLALDFHVFLNTTFLRDPVSNKSTIPFLSGLIGITPEMIQQMQAYSPINQDDKHNPRYAPSLDLYKRISLTRFYSLNTLHYINVEQSLRKRLNGDEEWSQTLQSADTIPVESFQLDQMFEGLLDDHSDDPDRVALLRKYRADPALEYMSLRLAFHVYSFDIRVEEEVWNYGFLAFLADLGGALNIGALIFAAAFPLWKAATKPRIFVGLWAWQAVGNCSRGSVEADESKRGDASENRMSLTVEDSGSQQPQFDSYRMRKLSGSRSERKEASTSAHSYEPPRFHGLQPGEH